MYRCTRAPSLRSIALVTLVTGVAHAQQAPAPAADHFRNGARAATVPHGTGSYSNGARNSTIPRDSAGYANGARAVPQGSPNYANGARAATVTPGSPQHSNGARAATVPTDSLHYANGARAATVPTDSPHYANGARVATAPFNSALVRPPPVASASAAPAPSASVAPAPSASVAEVESAVPEASAPVPSSTAPLVPEAASAPAQIQPGGSALAPVPLPASNRVTPPSKGAAGDLADSEGSPPISADEYGVADSARVPRERGPFARFLDVFKQFALVCGGVLVAAAAWGVALALTKQARANQHDEQAPQKGGKAPPRRSRDRTS